jgi:SAM-dependent methyltransferase
MKLSDLVAFKNELNQVSVHDIQSHCNQEIAKILHLVAHYNSDTGKITQTNEKLAQSFLQFENNLQEIKQSVQQAIDKEEMYWLRESYRLFEEEMRNEHHDYTLNRRPQLKEQTILLSRLRMYSDWKYPGMIIRPGLETFASEMVSYDPLYIVDTSRDLLGKVPYVNKFTPEYQARLRSVVVEENLDVEILEKIPDNQFGLCLVYNFFEFRPLEYIRKYLTEIYQKLRPGGVLIMTVNDCDRVPGVKLVESHYACYTPGNLILQLISSIGYDRIHTWHDNSSSTFIEIRKPGELTSLRGGQTLAKILSN